MSLVHRYVEVFVFRWGSNNQKTVEKDILSNFSSLGTKTLSLHKSVDFTLKCGTQRVVYSRILLCSLTLSFSSCIFLLTSNIKQRIECYENLSCHLMSLDANAKFFKLTSNPPFYSSFVISRTTDVTCLTCLTNLNPLWDCKTQNSSYYTRTIIIFNVYFQFCKYLTKIIFTLTPLLIKYYQGKSLKSFSSSTIILNSRKKGKI